MKKLFFLFENVWRQIVYDKFISTVMLVTMAIGLFFPLMAQNDVNDLLADGRIRTGADASRLAVIEYMMTYKETVRMENAVEGGIKEGLFDRAGFSAAAGQIIYVGEKSFSTGVCGVSEEYLELGPCELSAGELFSAEEYAGRGGKVCLIEHRGTLAKNGVKTGDTVRVLGDVYRVKGVIRAPWAYGGVLIPYDMTPQLFAGAGGQIQYQLLTYGENEPNPRILSFKLFPGESLIVAQTGEEMKRVYQESIGEANRYRMARAVLVIEFAVVNLSLLFGGKVLRERYGMSAHMAQGAGRAAVGVQVIAGNLCLMSAAFLFDILLYPAVASLVNGANRCLRIDTVLQVFAGGSLVVAVTAGLSCHIGFGKRRIALLLQKQA